MRVAVCQFAAGTDVAANLEQCVQLIDRAAAAGADLAVLPELAMFFDPRSAAGSGAHGQALDGPFATGIAAAAAAAGVAVVAGMRERAGDAPAPGPEEGRDHNTLIAVSAAGDLLGTYRKIHLYDAFGFRESDRFRAGAIGAPLVFRVAGVVVGAATCYDLRFPEMFRWLGDASPLGAPDLVVLPAAWVAGPAKERHWSVLLAARAVENTAYVAGAGQTGPVCCGGSQVVDPTGAVLAGAGAEPGIAVADVDTDLVRAVRATNPSLANRRMRVVPDA